MRSYAEIMPNNFTDSTYHNWYKLLEDWYLIHLSIWDKCFAKEVIDRAGGP